ncbi:MAG: hypothetical protein IT580_00165 [Verrucomicrobiales bacterium]|nr:hypothetical protein [Verrucomicrobiales bacterium]
MQTPPLLPPRCRRGFALYASRLAAVLLLMLGVLGQRIHAASFTPLTPLPAPTIAAAAEPFDDSYAAANLLRPPSTDQHRPEYASRGKGDKTFVDFDFGRPTGIAAFEHVQRRTPDTMVEARLVFSDSPGFEPALATVAVQHVDEKGATTFATFPPVTARYVRWQVTRVLPDRSPNLGGQSVRFFAAGATESAPGRIGIEARGLPIVERTAQGPRQPLSLTLDHPYAEAVEATVQVESLPAQNVRLAFGRHALEYSVPAGATERNLTVNIAVAGQTVASRQVAIRPAPHRTVYILPHSHTDIGYTAIQTDIEEKQINNLIQGLADARRTARYPEGSRFIWNVEVMWAADLFLQRLDAPQRAEFFAAVKNGQVSLNGMYLNELTGLCRPEELLRLFRHATELGHRTGVPVDSAMISDVPGYTWGTVTAMANAGIRYFSVAPNYFDRIGNILVEWENKPFWWVGPDGQSKVLVWIPFWGYAMSHRYGAMSPRLILDFCEGLEKKQYPYDIAYVRWAGYGDNAVPDPSICDFVKDWNATHEWPRFVISSTSEAFRAFEKQYGSQLPQVRGDWSPYWEDGAGSSSAETALNRASSERLSQAEALWAMVAPAQYPLQRFQDAWYNVLLYSEHTWGAYCSISEPAIPFTTDQWNIKQSYATTANLQSRQLLASATQTAAGSKPSPTPNAFDVFNTTSWPRSELALVPAELSGGGNQVLDDRGQPVPAQRLASGELAVLVRDLAPFSGRRYSVAKDGPSSTTSDLKIEAHALENAHLRVNVDETTGAITELRAQGIPANLVDTSDGHALNDYLYLLGNEPSQAQRNAPVKISLRDRGPLVATLRVESDAPGCHRLIRDVRLAAGSDHVELLNIVDKRRLAASNYFAKDGKESVNFAFPFQIPQGEMRLDLPLAVMRPEHDQMPSACKNWLTIGRWAEIANADFGITWVTLDTPLIQLGGLTANLLNSQTNPDVWRKTIEPTGKIYVWAMNNHWGTNYRAHQEGATAFRFVLRPHRGRTTDAANSRFATAFSQPLVVVPGRGTPPSSQSLLTVEPDHVLVTALKPSDDGKAWIVHLLGASGSESEATVTWAPSTTRRVSLSDTSERALGKAPERLRVPAWGLVTLRAERR